MALCLPRYVGTPLIQMAPGGTVYHWDSNGNSNPDKMTAIRASIIGQQNIPVFKLVSPDGSGGSYEAIIRNNGEVTLSDYDEWFQVLDSKLVTNIKHFGSYNYSETAIVGDEEHTRRDVKPPELDPGGYIFPTPGQVFPATHRGKPIADHLVFPAPEWVLRRTNESGSLRAPIYLHLSRDSDHDLGSICKSRSSLRKRLNEDSPCQGSSNANARTGIDRRNTSDWNICAIVQASFRW